MSDHLIVVSADCHAGLPIADYKPYVESKYHEMMDMAVPITIDMMDKAESTFLIKEINDAWRGPIKQQLTGAWDYEERLNMLAGDGIAAEVIFPDGITEKNTPPFRGRPRFVAPGYGAGTAVGRSHGTQSLAGRMVLQRLCPPYRCGVDSAAVGCAAGCGGGAVVRGQRPKSGHDSHIMGRA